MPRLLCAMPLWGSCATVVRQSVSTFRYIATCWNVRTLRTPGIAQRIPTFARRILGIIALNARTKSSTALSLHALEELQKLGRNRSEQLLPPVNHPDRTDEFRHVQRN